MTLAEIHARCERQGECLLWTGRRGKSGYPLMPVHGGGSLRPVVWRLAGKGEPPHVITTSCGNKACVSDEHLVRCTHQSRKRPRRAKSEVLPELPAGAMGGPGYHRGALILDLPAREAKARIGTESVANYGGIVPPNSPESFAICDAVRQEIVGKDKPGMKRPWLIGRSV